MKITEIFNVESELDFKGIMTYSKNKIADAIYFCLSGLKYDGHEFIDEAISNGAICIVHSLELAHYQEDILYLKVTDVLKTLHITIEAYYQELNDIKLIGVTGSYGKSNITMWLSNVLNTKYKCGYIGQYGVGYNGKVIKDYKFEAVELAEHLVNMVKSGVEYCVIELSAENLALEKLDFIKCHRLIFTNLDVNKDNILLHVSNDKLSIYQKLLNNMPNDALAIINIDDETGSRLYQNKSVDVLSYSIENSSELKADNLVYRREGLLFSFINDDHRYFVDSDSYGKTNVYHLLAVIAVAHSLNIEIEVILENIKKLPTIPGRMEKIGSQQFLVFVDQAFSGERFDYVLSSLKEINKNTEDRLIAVFGSAGKRDAKNRKVLGEVADKYCDVIILTEEDPRNELPKTIANNISEGISDTTYYFIENRSMAIEQAINIAYNDDIVVILGKGEEAFMDRGLGKKDSFYPGDAKVAKLMLDRR
ncbi:MAG: Mur ligase family protein [Erysipelotrichaceae bacterium]